MPGLPEMFDSDEEPSDEAAIARREKLRARGPTGMSNEDIYDWMRQDRSAPTLVETLKGQPMEALAFGQAHSCALTADGRVFAWGAGQGGKLGIGAVTSVMECYVPTPVEVCFPIAIEKVSCGYAHSAAVTLRWRRRARHK